ncbi:hypothetical protein YC2023_042668 [Brassica napus]
MDQFITDFQLPFIIDNQDNFKDSNKGKTFYQRWYIFWTVTRVTEIIFYYALHPLPKYPQRNHNYKVWSKGRERQQEDSLGAACNDIDRLIAGISSVIEVKPKKEDGKEKSGAGVKEASWIDLYLPEEARGYAKLARLDINPLELGCLLGLTCGKTFSQRWYIFWTVTRVTEIIFYYALHPLPKYPQRNHNYKVWSKGRERQQEDSLGAACNDIDRLIAGISSVIEVKPKKEDGKEKSGAGVKEASWIDLYLPEEARGYAKLARLDINPLELGCLLGLTCAYDGFITVGDLSWLCRHRYDHSKPVNKPKTILNQHEPIPESARKEVFGINA